jgi:hypothetical protein
MLPTSSSGALKSGRPRPGTGDLADTAIFAEDFMDKAKQANKPFFVWLNPTRMHVYTHLSPKYQAMETPDPEGPVWPAQYDSSRSPPAPPRQRCARDVMFGLEDLSEEDLKRIKANFRSAVGRPGSSRIPARAFAMPCRRSIVARRAHAAPRTVRTALACLSRLGAVSWVRRLVRCGHQVAQTSNAYVLLIGLVLSGGNFRRRIRRKNSVRRIEKDTAALAQLMTAASALPDLLRARREAWLAQHGTGQTSGAREKADRWLAR